MAARIRPFLLFWIGRDHVGGGRVVWRRGEGDTVAYELLIAEEVFTGLIEVNSDGSLTFKAAPAR